MIFIIALIFSGAIAFFLPDNPKTEPELMIEVQNIRSKLDILIG